MWFTATINAYDALDTVVVCASVRKREDDAKGRRMTVYRYATTADGVGESEPERWLKDALVALLETL